jgi:methionine synthase II (cobalamin-independent)
MDVVKTQSDAGVDVPNDGEFGKPMRAGSDLAAWGTYIFGRISGFGPTPPGAEAPDQTPPGQPMRIVGKRWEMREFPEFYASGSLVPSVASRPSCIGPIAYTGEAALRRDLANLKAAAEAAGVSEAFVTSIAVGSLEMFCLNHALRGLPEDRIRYHMCWGSWHGPHTTDIPLRDIADVMLRVKAQAYSVEAGNVRHEHEYKIWQDVKLPDGKLLIPGVVSHATNVVEHPEVVADRLLAYARVVGRENVVAGTDCGLGGRVHPQIAWAKLRSLSDGARMASRQLWRSAA